MRNKVICTKKIDYFEFLNMCLYFKLFKIFKVTDSFEIELWF